MEMFHETPCNRKCDKCGAKCTAFEISCPEGQIPHLCIPCDEASRTEKDGADEV